MTRLLAEHLAKAQLLAPVGEPGHTADDVHALEQKTASLLSQSPQSPQSPQTGESLALVLERIAARLGPERVLRPVVMEDHRIEWMSHWQSAPAPAPTTRQRKLSRSVDIPQPTFVFAQPLGLATRGPRPLYQGVLQLLAGPHRIEGGWWDRAVEESQATTRQVAQDY